MRVWLKNIRRQVREETACRTDRLHGNVSRQVVDVSSRDQSCQGAKHVRAANEAKSLTFCTFCIFVVNLDTEREGEKERDQWFRPGMMGMGLSSSSSSLIDLTELRFCILVLMIGSCCKTRRAVSNGALAQNAAYSHHPP